MKCFSFSFQENDRQGETVESRRPMGEEEQDRTMSMWDIS